MGIFVNDVCYGKCVGFSQCGFDCVVWEVVVMFVFDDDDICVYQVGLFFDVLFSQFCVWIVLDDIKVFFGVVVQLVVVVCNCNLVQLQCDMEGICMCWNGVLVIDFLDLLEQKFLFVFGELFVFDELIIGMGDGFRYMLCQLMVCGVDIWGDIFFSVDIFEVIVIEINKVIIYQCVVEYWYDCVGNMYGVSVEWDGLFICLFDVVCEMVCILLIYCCNNLLLQFGLQMVMWWCELDVVWWEKISWIILFKKLYGVGSIEWIDFGNNVWVFDLVVIVFGEVFVVQFGYYCGFLDELLFCFNGVVFILLIDIWCFLQVVGMLMNDGLFRMCGEIDMVCCVFLIFFWVLVFSVVCLLGIVLVQVQFVLDVLMFDGVFICDFWCQLLVWIGDVVVFMLFCILLVCLLCIVEGWMCQGGF